MMHVITPPRLFMVLLWWLSCIPIHARDTIVDSPILRALRNGNAAQISEHFDHTVNIILPESSGNYGKKQATQIMKYFYDHNPQKDFQLEMYDDKEKHFTYIIGKLTTIHGKTFRIFCIISHHFDENLIRQIQIEEL